MKKILFWLTGFLPVRYIDDGERRYLERYYVSTIFGVRIYIHRFVGSDPDRGLHNHPWRRAVSIILSGYYYEYNSYGVNRVNWINGMVGDSLHRIVLPKGEGPDFECWTLFMHTSEKVKSWGFMERVESENTEDRYYRIYTYAREGPQSHWWETAKTRGNGNQTGDRNAA